MPQKITIPDSSQHSQVVVLMDSNGQIRTALRVVAIIAGGMLLMLPTYINQELFSRLRLNVPVSLAVSVQLFALGIVLFVVGIGPEKLQRATRTEN